MKTWTVQCTYAAYYGNTVVVEAETLDEALGKAIETANDDSSWKSIDDYIGPTFIAAATEGDNESPWKTDPPYESVITIPERFTEHGEPPVVTVIVEGGAVQNVIIKNGPVRVQVCDYDTDGADPDNPRVRTDENGNRYELGEWR